MVNAVATMSTLLSTKWTKANTDSKVPRFIVAQDDKDRNNAVRINVSARDAIKIYEEAPENRKSNGIGANAIHRVSFVAIDIMVGTNQLHAVKVKDEVINILENNFNSPGTDFQYIEPDFDIQNFSGIKTQRLWRWVFSVEMVKTNATLGD